MIGILVLIIGALSLVAIVAVTEYAADRNERLNAALDRLIERIAK